MRVFQADQYWVDAPTQAEAAANDDAALARGPTGTVGRRDPVPAEPANADLEFSESFLELTNPTDDDTLFDKVEQNDTDSGAGDEQWARALLEEDDNQKTSKTNNSQLSAILAEPRNKARPATSIADNSAAALTPNGGDNDRAPSEIESAERWMQQILAPGQDDDSVSVAESNDRPEAPEWLASAVPAEPDEEYIPEVFRQQTAAIEEPPQIEPTVVKMRPRKPATERLKATGWWVAITASVLLLAFQYVWFNVENLAQDPDHRNLMLRFCKITGCTVPSSNDISRINNSNLVVFRHPRVQGALVLDTILTNHATFEQPYPKLMVEFTDSQERPVAARAFTPSEYLGGELSNSVLMPSKQPIHLSLELADPGDTAVNYRVRLLPL